LIAAGDIKYHTAERRPLQDVLTCIREGVSIHSAGFRLAANAERHLKPLSELERLFETLPDAVTRTMEIAQACRFSLDELRYNYPVDPVPVGTTPQDELARLAWEGAELRYPDGIPEKVRDQIAHELTLINDLGFAPYFLTVHDIVHFARSQDILCQGRGSAANSAVCYCIGITAVDPGRNDLLFERFVSAERGEPPDIDVDFESARREEVIQYVYAKYGRHRAGMTATVISFRTKGAIREVGKVLGLTDETIKALQTAGWRRKWDEITEEKIREVGVDPALPMVRMTMTLASELRGFPRHLSQHTGGMVITDTPLSQVVPIANAAMVDRTVIEWDKNDLDALGILKIDILGLGMLSAIHKCFDLIRKHTGQSFSLATVPAENPAVYDMLCAADSIGVFQVESRAQMSMLPRLRPRNFYDLVIQVAIVRPGPIQGDMVHPYLRRRRGEEKVSFPSHALRHVLGKTLGVPLFQEQAMKVAIVAAGFTPTESDQLRRALATFRNHGDIAQFQERFIRGMLNNGYDRDFAERCFKQIEGFADYGFPESHAASFALLVYISSWLKFYYPAAFTASLLNAQPMGFYAPAQLIRDLRSHDVEVRPVDVNLSDWDCTLEPVIGPKSDFALRLGFRQAKGLREDEMITLVDVRSKDGRYHDVEDLWRRTRVPKKTLETLARADAFQSLDLARRDAMWAVKGLDDKIMPLFAHAERVRKEPEITLPPAQLGEQIADDYRATYLSLKAHPLSVLREQLRARKYLAGDVLKSAKHGQSLKIAGLITTRQRPGSANGVMFITIEDEISISNLIVWPDNVERLRPVLISAQLLGADGIVQREGDVIHLLVHEAENLTPLLGLLDDPGAGVSRQVDLPSRNFH
jgi:error-prone DNA polymerase